MSPDTALVPQPTLDEFPEFVSISSSPEINGGPSISRSVTPMPPG